MVDINVQGTEDWTYCILAAQLVMGNDPLILSSTNDHWAALRSRACPEGSCTTRKDGKKGRPASNVLQATCLTHSTA